MVLTSFVLKGLRKGQRVVTAKLIFFNVDRVMVNLASM